MQKKLQIIDNDNNNIVFIQSDAELFLISQDLSNIIINKYEKKIIMSIVKKNYGFLEDNEQTFIEEESLKKLENSRSLIFDYIYNQINVFIKRENIINIRGFIVFRLREYIMRIENAIDLSVNEYLSEREYRELVKGLTVYIELQQPLLEAVDLICRDNIYVLTDIKGNEIFTLSNYDDVLLDALLTLAPLKLIIYNPEQFRNKELLKTIISVFGERTLFITS